jgi:SAM-dependent methyltransferase
VCDGWKHAVADGARLVFGSAADDYERYRPEYPVDLINAVLAYAKRPVHTALEVGAGTGKATRLIAARGVNVTALEPDREMAGVLMRATRDLPVEVVIATLEQFRLERKVDLVFAAAAWHWTDPSTRWATAVQLLGPGGILALFGIPGDLTNQRVLQTVDDIERRLLPSETRTHGWPWSFDEVRRTDGLTDVTEVEFPCSIVSTADDFVGRLGTVSSYLELDAGRRHDALQEVRAALPDHVEIDATAHLVLARRTS